MSSQIFRPKILSRKRVNDLLCEILNTPLFFVSASMGYGKTTAVKEFLEERDDIKSIWFSIDGTEDDDVWIWKKFCYLLSYTNEKLASKFNDYGVPKNSFELKQVLELIMNEVNQETVFVIDDWQNIEEKYISKIIQCLARIEIPRLHIVLISRRRPADEYMELELKRKCIVVWQEDIEFTYRETYEFFNYNGFDLSAKEIDKVFVYTGGWVAATYLALIEYNNENSFDNIPRAIELVKSAIYNKFDEETKRVLLMLSPLKNFTLEQAVYITKTKKAHDIIKELVLNNCFIKYDKKTKIYTVHSILKNVLMEECQSYDVDINIIYNACGDWLYKEGDTIQAIECYYKTKNFQRILEIFEEIQITKYMYIAPKLIISSFKEMSLEQKLSNPIAYISYIQSLILLEDINVGKNLLKETKVYYENKEGLNNKNQILAEIALTETLYAFNDGFTMIKLFEKSYKLFDGESSRIINKDMPFTFGSPHLLSLYYNSKGNLNAFADELANKIQYFIKISGSLGAGSEYLVQAEYYFETGQVEKSELLAYKALHRGKEKGQMSIVICAYSLLMRISVLKNDRSNTKDFYEEILKEYKNFTSPVYFTQAEIAIGYICGITYNLKEMPSWIRSVDKDEGDMLWQGIGIRHIVFGLVLLLKKSYIELEVYVETMQEEFSKKNNLLGYIYSYIFDSIAKYNLYGLDEALESFSKAVDIAKEDNIVMPFVELSTYIGGIVEQSKDCDKYIKTISSFIRKYGCVYSEIKDELDTSIVLTPREVEVMTLVEAGYKQSEIAESLHIALITVKKHISAVYSKLGVKNKTLAIKKLKDRDLL